MEVATTTYDVFTEKEFDHEITKVVHKLGDVTLYKQEMSSLGKLCDAQEICTGKGSIIEMLGTGALHLVVKDNTYNLVFCNHIISKLMNPITQNTPLVPHLKRNPYLSWPACDSNKKLVVFHLMHYNYKTFDHIRECISRAVTLAGEAEEQRAASLNIPGENCPPVDRADSCVTTDVQSECTMSDSDQSESTDVGDDQSDVVSEERQQMQYKMSAVQSISKELRDVTKEQSGVEKMNVLLESHARQMQVLSETMEQKLSEGMEQMSRQMEQLQDQAKQLQDQEREANASVAPLKKLPEKLEQLQDQDRTADASVIKLEAQLDQYKALAKNLINPLLNMCNKHFTEEMLPADVFQMLQFAQMIDSKPLRECCIKMLQDRTEDVLTADTWVDVSADFILAILQQDCLNVDSELTLLLACHRWANHQPGGDQRQHLAPLLPYLRLRTLTAEDFMDFTLKHKIFTTQEKFQIMGCIAKPAMKMPDGFCNNGTLRTNESTGLSDSLDGKEISSMDLVPTRRYNKHTDSSRIKFLKDIVMYGVRLQVLHVDTNSKRKFDQHLTTTVKVYIENHDRVSVLLEHTFESNVNNGGHFDVQFPQPCYVNSKSACYISINFHDHLARHDYRLQSKSYPDILCRGNFNLCSVSKIFYKMAR